MIQVSTIYRTSLSASTPSLPYTQWSVLGTVDEKHAGQQTVDQQPRTILIYTLLLLSLALGMGGRTAVIAHAMLHNPGREAREAQSLTEVNHGNEEDE